MKLKHRALKMKTPRKRMSKICQMKTTFQEAERNPGKVAIANSGGLDTRGHRHMEHLRYRNKAWLQCVLE